MVGAKVRVALAALVIAIGVVTLAQGCATGGSASPDGGPGPGMCQSPNTTCGSACVDTSTDSANCGGCGMACTGSLLCSQGKCSATCTSGTTCTPDGGKAYCATTSTDPKNCGSCGNVCSSGTCSGGKCSGSSGCTGGETSCPTADGGTTCVTTSSDPNHCGNCTTTCLPTIETCTAGACVSACTSGLTLCIPDGGVADAGAECANLQTDNNNCGTCFYPCLGGATCTLGACVSTLLGTGTAGSPWHTATPLANCAAYLKQFPTATDGVYTTHPSTTDIGVYCDMTHSGITYENFGFGQYSASYTGYTFVGVSDFTGTTQFAAAFAYLYTRNTGLVNINPGGWSDSNCCIENTGGASFLALGGSSYMYPAVGGTADCTTTYSASYIELTLETAGTVLSSITQAQASSATSSTTCSTSGNPGIFVKKY